MIIAAAIKTVAGFIRSWLRRRSERQDFARLLQPLSEIPYVIGVDWFQYYDEPTHGRFDGENFNFGLWTSTTVLTRRLQLPSGLDLRRLKSAACRGEAGRVARRSTGAAKSDGTFEPNLALKHWDRERGFVRPISEFPLADLYICWNKEAIYLGLYAQDVTEDTFYKDKIVRASDRAEWIISSTAHNHSEPDRSRAGACSQ